MAWAGMVLRHWGGKCRSRFPAEMTDRKAKARASAEADSSAESLTKKQRQRQEQGWLLWFVTVAAKCASRMGYPASLRVPGLEFLFWRSYIGGVGVPSDHLSTPTKKTDMGGKVLSCG
jgi:hypothetical protein